MEREAGKCILRHRSEQVRMLQKLDSAYSSMVAFATMRLNLETGLEQTSAQSRTEQVKVRLRQPADLRAFR